MACCLSLVPDQTHISTGSTRSLSYRGKCSQVCFPHFDMESFEDLKAANAPHTIPAALPATAGDYLNPPDGHSLLHSSPQDDKP